MVTLQRTAHIRNRIADRHCEMLLPAPPMEDVMRAEIQNIVDEIKQSVVLLRRHL